MRLCRLMCLGLAIAAVVAAIPVAARAQISALADHVDPPRIAAVDKLAN